MLTNKNPMQISGEFLFPNEISGLGWFFFLKKSKLVTSWWFQPPTHLKKYDRQIGSFPPILGMNMQKIFELPPPR